MNALKKMWGSFDQFFFAPMSYAPAALFRIVFSGCLLLMYSLRILDWRFYFTDEGIIPAAQALDLIPEFCRPMFTWYPSNAALILPLHVLFLVLLFILMIGWWSRLAAALSLVLHLAFLQRNFSIAYGADIVSNFFLFGLCWIESDRYLSVRSFLARRGKGRGLPPMTRESEILSTVGIRLIQIQLCLIYGWTGMEKLKGAQWWDGTAIWPVIGNSQIMMVDLSWLKQMPLLIAVMTFSTFLWEIYFPALVWIRPIRRYVLLFGVFLHAMIALSVGLVFFSTAMVSTYIFFVDREWLTEKILRFWPDGGEPVAS